MLLQLFEMLTSPHGPVKLTHNITCYREDWGGRIGLAGIASALLWPAQGRVFCWAIQILLPKREVGTITRRKEKGYQGAAGPFLQRISLDHLGLTSRHSSLLWLPLWALPLCERGAVRMRKEIISVLLPLLFQSPVGVTFEGRPMETCAHNWALKLWLILKRSTPTPPATL